MTIANQIHVIRPRLLPRTFADLAITMFVAFPLQATPLFIVPAAVTFIASSSLEMAFFAALFVYVLFLLFSVWSIALSKEGIRFKRLLGGPKLLQWSDVISITEVPRWELIWRGWLWPLFPAKEMTACLSSVHHYKIAWRGGFCYYPPADTNTFMHHVKTYFPGREA